MLIILMIFIFLISLILMMFNVLLSKKEWLDREKLIMFECGFDSMSLSRLPFSINFYLFGLLFLIFDVEIVYLFPMIDLFMFLNIFEWFYLTFMIIMVLYLGLEFEKKEGSLKWMF